MQNERQNRNPQSRRKVRKVRKPDLDTWDAQVLRTIRKLEPISIQAVLLLATLWTMLKFVMALVK